MACRDTFFPEKLAACKKASVMSVVSNPYHFHGWVLNFSPVSQPSTQQFARPTRNSNAWLQKQNMFG